LGNGLHVHGNEQHFAAHIGSRSGRLATGVTGAYNNHIVFWKHAAKLACGTQYYCRILMFHVEQAIIL
jgi:hypothetical protein